MEEEKGECGMGGGGDEGGKGGGVRGGGGHSWTSPHG